MHQERHNEPDGSCIVYTYDDAKRRLRTTHFDAAGTVTLDIVYDHSPVGVLTGWSIFLPAGVLFKRFERQVGADGLEEVLQFDAGGQLELRTREIRDPNGIRLVHFDRDGKALPG